MLACGLTLAKTNSITSLKRETAEENYGPQRVTKRKWQTSRSVWLSEIHRDRTFFHRTPSGVPLFSGQTEDEWVRKKINGKERRHYPECKSDSFIQTLHLNTDRYVCVCVCVCVCACLCVCVYVSVCVCACLYLALILVSWPVLPRAASDLRSCCQTQMTPHTQTCTSYSFTMQVNADYYEMNQRVHACVSVTLTCSVAYHRTDSDLCEFLPLSFSLSHTPTHTHTHTYSSYHEWNTKLTASVTYYMPQ